MNWTCFHSMRQLQNCRKGKLSDHPMAISGSADIWENHFPRVKKTHVILEYGKPIYIDQLEKEDKKHLGAYTQNIIHEMLVKNKAQL